MHGVVGDLTRSTGYYFSPEGVLVCFRKVTGNATREKIQWNRLFQIILQNGSSKSWFIKRYLMKVLYRLSFNNKNKKENNRHYFIMLLFIKDDERKCTWCICSRSGGTKQASPICTEFN
jgi:hypothetical protein